MAPAETNKKRYQTPLTNMELEILVAWALAPFPREKAVANRFSISRKTVNNHVQSAHIKLGVSSTRAAIAAAKELGYI